MDTEFTMPVGYQWLIDKGLVGFEPFSQLQPWHYMRPDQCFWVAEKWPGKNIENLYVFARRQDNDDLACILFQTDGVANGVVLIQGWTAAGFDVVKVFPDFWSWMQQVIQDISEWIALE